MEFLSKICPPGNQLLDLNLVKNAIGVSSQVGKRIINIIQGRKLIVID